MLVRTPAKKVNYGSGYYSYPTPHTSSFTQYADKEDVEAIHKCFDTEVKTHILRFQRYLSEITVLKLTPNKTGRKINVRAEVFDEKVSFSAFPYEGSLDKQDSRSIRGIQDELIEHMLKKESKFFETVINTMRRNFKKNNSNMWRIITTIVLKQYMLQRPPQEGVKKLHGAINTFVSEGRHLGNFNSHQSAKATETFREAALHAMSHGAKFEDLLNALQEEAVRATLDV